MNNSKIAIDSIALTEEKDRTPELREREATIVRIMSAIRKVADSQEWSSLKTEVFDGLVIQLEKELREEAKKDSPDSLKLNRLAGQLKWAEKYADLDKLGNIFRDQLKNIRIQLHGKES